MIFILLAVIVIVFYIVYVIDKKSNVDIKSKQKLYYSRQLLKSLIELKDVIESEKNVFLEIDMLTMKMSSLIEYCQKHDFYSKSIISRLESIKFYRVMPRNEYIKNLNTLTEEIMATL